MLRIEFTPADLARLRFAHSPMVEVVASVLTRGDPAFHPLFGAPHGHLPDFLTPVPVVSRPRLDDELRTIVATPPDRVVAEVTAAWAGLPVPPAVQPFLTDPARALAALVPHIKVYTAATLAPRWPRLRAVVDAEITRRALAATVDGPRALLDDLHPRLDWDGTALRVHYPNKHREWTLDGHPLTLLPTGFAGFETYFQTEPPDGRALWFPPRGRGAVLDPAGKAPDHLAALLGPTRAAVLTLLAAPHSTGEVASALNLAAATASHHLTTLRDAGLVSADRAGRRLHYVRTPLGEQLAGDHSLRNAASTRDRPEVRGAEPGGWHGSRRTRGRVSVRRSPPPVRP